MKFFKGHKTNYDKVNLNNAQAEQGELKVRRLSNGLSNEEDDQEIQKRMCFLNAVARKQINKNLSFDQHMLDRSYERLSKSLEGEATANTPASVLMLANCNKMENSRQRKTQNILLQRPILEPLEIKKEQSHRRKKHGQKLSMM